MTVASVAALLVFVGYTAVGGGSSRGRSFPGAASRSVLPAPHVKLLVASRETVPGRRGPLPWPSTGEGAVAVLGSGLVARSPQEKVAPIASLTKMMTAYVLLADHPLALGASGPSFRMSRADAALWVSDSQMGDSTLPVQAGEVLSEYQLLEGLLIPSGDNVATMLATWDAGSERAFVAKMNAMARALGLAHTHYADASGLDPRSRSTAADQAVLGALLMNDPVVRRIVSYASLAFPVAGTIWNYNPALGTDGIVGVKSGFTPEAQACLVTAAYRNVGGRSVLVVVASLNQPGGLGGAAATDESLLSAASGGLVRAELLPRDGHVARAKFAWSNLDVAVDAPDAPRSVVTWPGTVLALSLLASPTHVTMSATSGASGSRSPLGVGTLEVRSTGGLDVSAPLVTEGALPAVPAGWTPPAG